jgi:hypothetical protein
MSASFWLLNAIQDSINKLLAPAMAAMLDFREVYLPVYPQGWGLK